MAQPPYDPYGGYGHSDPYAQQSYQQPAAAPVQHHYYGAPTRPNNGMATASLVLGIIGIFACGLTSILAIIFGHVAHSQIKRTGEGGAGMATAGLVMGYILTVGWLLYWVVIFGIYGVALWGASQSGTTY
ncbi:DUF4190 domain-containing protein [Actinomadura viridis]|uniref:DUF4190 domain-containing protein n=1 Tax=Actinomadura viridis TaxID=58110 RepID=A0A931GR02_9ACTN|nr:DUF4190 domain-containing protein [Actinomadura viridis]MBG6092301.1 hypothetical protein [Actinomadura viridis]